MGRVIPLTEYRIEEGCFEETCKDNCFEPIHFHFYFLNFNEEQSEGVSKIVLKRSRDIESRY